ncbi:MULTISPECIES: stage V sporulation protein AA [Alteribacter]|uniref:Stage V sporulation protein AA n=1 Tax=Alteribacter keqinensis TaxID=2483800 RepID=A0A3M7TWA2_9BACI|nr:MULTISPECIES: stage V sporulation protein AA [Alteribacter]MBM7094740.1 stage V sporulation protein AA [Alteribacter salitolerans]RNA69064.1 stage V sporulation protein AA [Alteribacter keqinensis]
MDERVYIRLKARVRAPKPETLMLKDIAQLIADEQMLRNLEIIPVNKAVEKDQESPIVIDSMKIVELILSACPNADVQVVGPVQTIVWHDVKKQPMKPLMFSLVWFLLFVGSALAIMNFHEDVSMSGVHKKLYRVITGTEVDHPLWLQIPYSFGLGLGMILFFNHLFRKRINDEPSPLEMEMFNYEDNIDRYVALNHRREDKRKQENKK